VIESSLPDQVVLAPDQDSTNIPASRRRLAKGGVLLFWTDLSDVW
jgi:hypothetical protein